MIESPAYGGFLGNPATVTGIANTFEANVAVTLADSDGLIIFEGFTTATCGTGCFGSFEISFPYAVARPQMGSLIAFEISRSRWQPGQHPGASGGSDPVALTLERDRIPGHRPSTLSSRIMCRLAYGHGW